MSNPITIATAPCCWGVDDAKNPHLPHWEKVLDEAKASGFGGLELGPYGYLPLDRELVSEALNKRGLKIVAGTIFDDLLRLVPDIGARRPHCVEDRIPAVRLFS